MVPDTTWSGILVPMLHGWLPNVPVWILTLVVGTVVSILYGLVRKNPPATPTSTPNPVHVAIPAIVTGILGGLPGLVLGAAGDGIRRGGGAILLWLGKRFGVG